MDNASKSLDMNHSLDKLMTMQAARFVALHQCPAVTDICRRKLLELGSDCVVESHRANARQSHTDSIVTRNKVLNRLE